MELIQSFVYTIQRSKLTLYEQRILLKVVEHAQSRLRGLVIKNNLYKWQHDFDNVEMIIPIKDILTDGSQHYSQVREAASRLTRRVFEYQDAVSGKWFSSSVIYNASHDPHSGVIKFYVSRTLFDVLLDFSKGFRQYSLETALSLSSPYASRLYSLMCGQSSPLRLEVTELKKMFGVEDKYAQTADFIKKIITPSQKCLDDYGCTSFTFSRVKQGQKVVALLFFPVKRDEPTVEQRLAKVPVSLVLSKEIKITLMQIAGFTMKELGPHKVLFDEFAKLPECYSVLLDIVNRMVSYNKNKGYVIAAMRSEVKEFREKQLAGSAAAPAAPGSSEREEPAAHGPSAAAAPADDEPSLYEDMAALGLIED